MEDAKDAIIEAISTSVEDLKKKPSVKMFLITETKNKNEPYVMYKINIKGKVPDYFLETLEKRLHAASAEIKNKNET